VPTPPKRFDTFVVGDADTGRLDQFVARQCPQGSRRLARIAIEAGKVLVNQRRGRKGQTLQPGDVVRADLSEVTGGLAAQPELTLSILFSDEAVVAVDKPAGIPAVALRAGERGTVANALLAYDARLRDVGGRRLESGLVHRLDTPTSGVLLAARTTAAWQGLRRQFRSHAVDKLYVAVVAGNLTSSGRIAVPLAHRPGHPRRMLTWSDPERAGAPRARPALTRYRPLRQVGARTLLAVRIVTGVRHQIRAHLASIGHPVLGDPLYADPAVAQAAPRLLLHAVRLGFTHPTRGQRLIVRSPLPDDFEAALRGNVAPATSR
jgi:23S rRNA pseudouridine1911/1915/1917 synthase